MALDGDLRRDLTGAAPARGRPAYPTRAACVVRPLDRGPAGAHRHERRPSGLEDATTLTRRDLQLAVVFLGSLTEIDDQSDLWSRGLGGLAAVLPGQLLVYTEIDHGVGWSAAVAHPAEALGAEGAERYATLVGDHPLVRHFERTGDSGPTRLSDIALRVRRRDLPIYRDVLGPLGIEHEIGVRLRWRGGLSAGVITSRSGGDFSDDERELLAFVAPPLLHTAMRLRRRTIASRLLAGVELPRDLLSDREREVLGHVAHGQTNASIARTLGVSPRTVDKHLENIYRKLEVTGRVAAVRRLLTQRPPVVPSPRAPLAAEGDRPSRPWPVAPVNSLRTAR